MAAGGGSPADLTLSRSAGVFRTRPDFFFRASTRRKNGVNDSGLGQAQFLASDDPAHSVQPRQFCVVGTV